MVSEKPVHAARKDPQQPGVEEFRARLELVMNHVVVWKEKKFKKLPAKAAIEDIEFLTFVIMTQTQAVRELREELEALAGPKPGELVGLDGKKLSSEGEQPTIVLATH